MESADMPDSINERLSFNDAVEIMGDFLEVALSTILYLRNLYQPAIFTRVKAYDVPVYQCRHPEVRSYIATFVRSVLGEMRTGRAERITMVISSISTGEPLERFLFDMSYMDLGKFRSESDKSVGLIGSPSQTEMRLILQGFLTRLSVLEGQLIELDPEDVTFALLLTMKEGTVPSLDLNGEGVTSSDSRQFREIGRQSRNAPEATIWVPEMRPRTSLAMDAEGHRDTVKGKTAFRSVSSIATGIVNLDLVIHEYNAKSSKSFRPALP